MWTLVIMWKDGRTTVHDEYESQDEADSDAVKAVGWADGMLPIRNCFIFKQKGTDDADSSPEQQHS